MENETEKKSSRGVLIAAAFLLIFGAVVGPKIVDGASRLYERQRSKLLMAMLSSDLDGKSWQTKPNGKELILEGAMGLDDYRKALYVLDLRRRQCQEVINAVESTIQWDVKEIENE